jgi:hypothetical protein
MEPKGQNKPIGIATTLKNIVTQKINKYEYKLVM